MRVSKISLLRGFFGIFTIIVLLGGNFSIAVARAQSLVAPVLTVAAASINQINLSWTYGGKGNFSGFYIERSTSSASGFLRIAAVSKSVRTYKSTGLQPSTTYYYRIRAYLVKNGIIGYSLYSNTASAMTFSLASGNVLLKRVGLDGFTSSAPSGTVASIDTQPSSIANPASYNSVIAGTHTAYATDVGGYQETAGVCSFLNGTTECSITTFPTTPSCNTTSCSLSFGVSDGQTTKVVFRYTDVVPPTITIVSPTSSPTYTITTSTIVIGVIASDNDRVGSVRWVNNTNARSGTATVGGPGWIANVPLVSGSNSIVFTAQDPTGNTATDSIAVTYTPPPPPPDTTPPNVSITSPLSGSVYTTAQTVSLIASASDNIGGSGMSKVDFYDNGVRRGTATVSPYSYAWPISDLNNGVHAWVARAYDLAGNSASSSPISITINIDATAPSTPLGVTAVSLSCNQIKVSWLPSTDGTGSGVSGYNVYRNNVFLSFVAAPTTSTIDSGLPANTTSSYQISALDYAANESGLSGIVSGHTPSCSDTTPPSITNVTASSITSSGATISWTTNESADTQVEYGPTTTYGFSSTLAVSLTTSHSVTLSGLAAGTLYHYRVKSRDASGNLGVSGDLTFTTVSLTDTTPPSVPTGLAASPASCSQVNLTWSASTDTGGSGLLGYNVYVWRNSAWTFLKQVLAPATATSDTGLSASTIYYYAVVAVDKALNVSAQSPWVSATTSACTGSDTTPPTVSITAPLNNATVSGIAAITANASDNVGVVGVQFKLDGLNLGAEDATSPYTISWNTASSTNGLHTLTAIARDAAGNSATSVGITVTVANDTTPPSTPTGLTTAIASCSQVNLSWNVSTDVGGSGLKAYNIYRNNVFVAQVLAPTISWSDTGLAASTGYSYYVTAVDNAGNSSGPSAAVSVTTPACPVSTANLNLVGFIPGVGSAQGVLADPNSSLVYVPSAEFGLTVFDVSNLTQPKALGSANPVFDGLTVTVEGNLAVVGAYGALDSSAVPGLGVKGLQVVDLADPKFPKVIGGMTVGDDGTQTVSYLALKYPYAYIGFSVPGSPLTQAIGIVDLSIPSAPKLVTRVGLPNTCIIGDIRLAGNNLVVGCKTTGIQVLDISSVAGFRIIGSLDGFRAERLSVNNSFVYVGTSPTYGPPALRIIDLTQPTNPVLVNTLPSSPIDLVARGNHLAVLGSSNLSVYDITNPRSPVLLTSGSNQNAQRLDVKGNTAFLLGPNGLMAVDLSNLNVTSRVPIDDFHASSLALDGYTTYALGYDGNNTPKVRALNTVDPKNPQIIATLTLAGFFGSDSVSSIHRIGASGNKVYTDYSYQYSPDGQTLKNGTDFTVTDFSSPLTPRLLSRLFLGDGFNISKIVAVGNTVYLIGNFGLKIIDVTNPSSPQIRGSYTGGNSIVDLVVNNGYAFLAFNQGTSSFPGQILDVRNPSNPLFVVNLPKAFTLFAFSTSTQRLYFYGREKVIVGGNLVDAGALCIISITNPNNPTLIAPCYYKGAGYYTDVGTVADFASLSNIAAFGNLLFEHSGCIRNFGGGSIYQCRSGIKVIDATDPSNLKLLGWVFLPGGASSMEVNGNYLYISDSASTVDILNVSNS